MRGSLLSTYSEDKERYVDYWDSYYDGDYRTHTSLVKQRLPMRTMEIII
ncbi:MAG: hypothetical protein ACI3XQ_02430 [Eubacteriales bacterium]